jgi:hypothetical protein
MTAGLCRVRQLVCAWCRAGHAAAGVMLQLEMEGLIRRIVTEAPMKHTRQ